MNILEKIDARANEKGEKIETLWQFVKFNLMGTVCTIIQVVLVNVLPMFFKNINSPIPQFLSGIFNENILGKGNATMGYILPYFISLIVSNTVGYILGKKITFNSDAPRIYFLIYFVVLLFMIVICTAIQGIIVNYIEANMTGIFLSLKNTIASMMAGFVLVIVMFPFQKYILFKN